MKQIKKTIVDRIKTVLIVSLFVGAANLVNSPQVFAQDGVYQFKASGGSSKTSGKITEISPDGVTIAGKLVPASKIDRVSFSREPSEINRARDQMETGRFSDAMESLSKMDVTKLTPQTKPEVDFIRAFSMAQNSLRPKRRVQSSLRLSVITRLVGICFQRLSSWGNCISRLIVLI